jgi:hypothetical protein
MVWLDLRLLVQVWTFVRPLFPFEECWDDDDTFHDKPALEHLFADYEHTPVPTPEWQIFWCRYHTASLTHRYNLLDYSEEDVANTFHAGQQWAAFHSGDLADFDRLRRRWLGAPDTVLAYCWAYLRGLSDFATAVAAVQSAEYEDIDFPDCHPRSLTVTLDVASGFTL